jgi:hypothetical protein
LYLDIRRRVILSKASHLFEDHLDDICCEFTDELLPQLLGSEVLLVEWDAVEVLLTDAADEVLEDLLEYVKLNPVTPDAAYQPIEDVERTQIIHFRVLLVLDQVLDVNEVISALEVREDVLQSEHAVVHSEEPLEVTRFLLHV